MIRVLRLSMLLAVAALAAACSGASDEARTDPAATTAATEPAETATEQGAAPVPRPDGALKRAVAAARADDARALWELLSVPTRERMGPSFARFRRGAAPGLRTTLASFARGRARVFLAERVTEEFAVAAYGGRLAEGPHAAFATALRLEDGAWKLELGGPVQLEALVPDPGEIERRATGAQLAAGIVADAAIREGGLWIDGRSVPGKSGGTDERNITIFSDPFEFERGPHAAVAFASTAFDASALAWMFTVR
jgi:hypothetical protein